MDCTKTGTIIKQLRIEKNLTQKQLADMMNISDKTVSKWERGLGCPDVSLLKELSDILGIELKAILDGDIMSNSFVSGNMKKSKFYVCPFCGNVTICTGNAEITCCGRKLTAQSPVKANKDTALSVEQVEDDWYITSSHKMTKDNYISFAGLLTGDKMQIIKQYPEWDFQVRIPKREHGLLIWFSTTEGLFYCNI